MNRERLFLSTLPAERGERWLAFGVASLSLVVFALLAPFAQVKFAPVPAFIPIYESALMILDAITATLLFAQARIIRSPALLVLANGYLFTTLLTVLHALSFPGLFAPQGLLGAGPQTTAWLYMFWHAGFPLVVIAYSLLKEGSSQRLGWLIAASNLVTVVIVAAFALLATDGAELLPDIMAGNGYTPTYVFVVSTVWASSLAALVVLLSRRPYSVLDIWLMVTMAAWLADVALAALLNAGRYDLGFYAGRIYGLLAASFVLLMLLLETVGLYARVARTLEARARERERRLQQVQTVLNHVSRVSELTHLVPAMAHEVTQPLAAISNYIEAARTHVESGNAKRAAELLRKAGEQAERGGIIVRRLRDFVKDEEPLRAVQSLPELMDEALALALVGKTDGIAVTVKLAPATSRVVVDKVQILQVLVNLIRNAAEAMAQSATRNLTVTSTVTPEGRVEICVADSGPGIAPEIQGKLFQPFVTTKGEGMGVGLSICRSIVESHGGTLWADNLPEGGAAFRFTLPAAVAGAETTAAESLYHPGYVFNKAG